VSHAFQRVRGAVSYVADETVGQVKDSRPEHRTRWPTGIWSRGGDITGLLWQVKKQYASKKTYVRSMGLLCGHVEPYVRHMTSQRAEAGTAIYIY